MARDGQSAGTLDDGSAAAVVRVDLSAQHYGECDGEDGLETSSVGPWKRHANVVVCALGAAPTCSAPVRVAWPRRGCRAALAAGTLTIATRGGRETRHVTH